MGVKAKIHFEIEFKDLNLINFSKCLNNYGVDFDSVVIYENGLPVGFNDNLLGEFEEAEIHFYYHYEPQTYWQPSHTEFEYYKIIVKINEKEINILDSMTEEFYEDFDKQDQIYIKYSDSIIEFLDYED